MKCHILVMLVLSLVSGKYLNAQNFLLQNSIYDGIHKRFDSGYLPDLSVFDMSRGLPGKYVKRNDPNTIKNDLQLVCATKGDEVSGNFLFCTSFELVNPSGKKNDIDDLKTELLTSATPLTKSEDGTAYVSLFKFKDENICTRRFFWREVSLDSGARLLIAKSSISDDRKGCEREDFGVRLDYYYLSGNPHSSGDSI